MVYTAKIGGKTERIVSVATMEGVWFAYNAATGAPIYQRVKVIDNVEHPNLKPGKPVVDLPVVARRPQLLARLLRPADPVRLQRRRRDGVRARSADARPRRSGRLCSPATSSSASRTATTASISRPAGRTTARSARSTSPPASASGSSTPRSPSAAGPTTTASGIGFVGGGDGNLRAFDVKTGKVLWTFQTGAQIADGPSIYSINGTEYIAIGVGGTPTSSLRRHGRLAGAGLLARRQHDAVDAADDHRRREAGREHPGAHGERAHADLRGEGRVLGLERASADHDPAGAVRPAVEPEHLEHADGHRPRHARGQARRGRSSSRSAAGLAAPTDSTGAFSYPVDITDAGRHVATVADRQRRDRRRQEAHAQHRASSCSGRTTGISVGYSVSNVSSHVAGNGNVVLTGRLSYGQNGGGAAERSPLQLRAQGHDHRRQRQPGAAAQS